MKNAIRWMVSVCMLSAIGTGGAAASTNFDFDSGAQGWVATGFITAQSSGGNPGGWLRYQSTLSIDPSGTLSVFPAFRYNPGTPFLDPSATAIAFDLEWLAPGTGTVTGSMARFRLDFTVPGGGYVIPTFAGFPPPTSGVWTSESIDLMTTGGEFCPMNGSCTVYNAAAFQALVPTVLATATDVRVTATFTFNGGAGGGTGTYMMGLDNFRQVGGSATPEPGTWVGAGLGIVGLALRCRSRMAR